MCLNLLPEQFHHFMSYTHVLVVDLDTAKQMITLKTYGRKILFFGI